jgi:hypothetical protein
MMQVEFGNPLPASVDASPVVTYTTIPDSYTYKPAKDADVLAGEIAMDVMAGDPAITHLPDQEAAVAMVSVVRAECLGQPTWVWSDNPKFATLLGKLFGCPVGRPDDVEVTHYTNAGPPEGQGQ